MQQMQQQACSRRSGFRRRSRYLSTSGDAMSLRKKYWQSCRSCQSLKLAWQTCSVSDNPVLLVHLPVRCYHSFQAVGQEYGAHTEILHLVCRRGTELVGEHLVGEVGVRACRGLRCRSQCLNPKLLQATRHAVASKAGFGALTQ